LYVVVVYNVNIKVNKAYSCMYIIGFKIFSSYAHHWFSLFKIRLKSAFNNI